MKEFLFECLQVFLIRFVLEVGKNLAGYDQFWNRLIIRLIHQPVDGMGKDRSHQ